MATEVKQRSTDTGWVFRGWCDVTGDLYEVEITTEEYHAWRVEDRPIQDAIPRLNDGQREFLMTGITPAEWASLFNDEEE